MPRRKVSIGLISNRRLRASTFAKRKAGLKKKASELSTLCGVRIALVCAAGDGSGAVDVWESAAGVIDAYRELPPEERARHTHGAYAEVELHKAEGKHVRVRQDGPPALASWDAKIFGLGLDDARRLLAAVDEALRAVSERQAALGLPVHDGNGSMLNEFAPPPGASDAVVPFGLVAPPASVGSNMVGLDGYMLRAHGNNNVSEQQAIWDGGFDVNWQPGYAFQQCAAGSYPDIDSYKLQMAAADLYADDSSSSIGRLSWDAFHPAATDAAVAMHPTGRYGFECINDTGKDYVGMSSYLVQQQVPSNAIVPLGYPVSLEMGFNYMDAPAAQLGTGGGSFAGGNFNAALSLTMGTGDNSFVNALQAQPLAMSYTGDLLNAGDYVSQWPAGQQPEQSSNKPLWEAL